MRDFTPDIDSRSLEFEEIRTWDDDAPSALKRKRDHDLVFHLSTEVMRQNIQINQLSKDLSSFESTLESYELHSAETSRRIQRLEQTVSTGTNCLTSRVSVLEQADRGFYAVRDDDKKELENLKAVASFLKNFPFGFKGAIFGIILSVVLIATLTDVVIRTQGIQVIKQFLKD